MTADSPAEAVANGRAVTRYDVGMCQKYVRGPCWEVGSLYGSAIDAWNGAKYRHPGDRNPPNGACVYYSGGNYGHAVISVGGGRIRSTDCQTSGNVNDTDIGWPERNWGYSYLGWTEDINGVHLPGLSGGGDDGGDDDMPQYDHTIYDQDAYLGPDGWLTITWNKQPGGDAVNIPGKLFKIQKRKYTATLHASFEAPEGSTIRLRTVEIEDGEIVETNPQVEFLATSGTSYAEYTHAGAVGEGHALAFRVSCSQTATLTYADAVVLSWA